MTFILTLAYIFLLYVRPFDLDARFEDVPVMMWLGAMTLVLSLIWWFVTPPARRSSFAAPQVWLTLLFVILAAWPWLLAGDLFETRRTLLQLQPMLGAVFMVLMNVNSMKRMRWLMATVLLAFTIMAGQGLVSYYFGWRHDTFVMDQREDVREGDEPRFIERVRHLGFLNDPNDFAHALVTMLPLVFLAWRPKKWTSNALIVGPLVGVFFWTTVLTRSRGGLVALSLTILLALRERLGRVKAALLTSVLVAGFLLLNLGAGRAFNDESAENRVEAWASGVMLLRERPLFGVGFNGFVEEHAGLTAHNTFVLAFSETGLVGYFVWIGLLVLAYLELTRLTRLPGDGSEVDDIRRWARFLRLTISAFLAGAYFLSRTYVVTLYLLIVLGVCLKQIADRDGHVIEPVTIAPWMVQTLAWQSVTLFIVWLSVKVAGA